MRVSVVLASMQLMMGASEASRSYEQSWLPGTGTTHRVLGRGHVL